MKVAAVTIPAAAANPSHPDHARWVKDRTLAREVAHQRVIGGTLRDAEAENARQLERMENRKRLRKPQPPKKPRAPSHHVIDHGKWNGDRLFGGVDDQIRELHGVTVRAAPKRKPPSPPPCGAIPCRTCTWCKRSIRVSMICVKAREQDVRAIALKNELAAIMLAASGRRDYRDAIGRELPFSRITGPDVDKAVTQGIEWACDRSVSFMGQWR